MRDFATWACLAQASNPDIVGHECVKGFPVWLLEFFFDPEKWQKVQFDEVDPKDYGFPVSRPRRFTFLVNRSRVICKGSA
eukprot:14074026-Alexandrium_andersonii.AAC.1